jgi:hypothetical protein
MPPVSDAAHRSWFYANTNGQMAIAVVKDIDAIVYALRECLAQAESEPLRDDLEAVVDLIEFALVTVKKNGMVQWKSGDFA